MVNGTVETRIKEPQFFGVRLAKVLKLRSFGQKSLLVAVQSVKGHISFTKPFLLKMGCEISGWRFLKFWFFYAGFYCIFVSRDFFAVKQGKRSSFPMKRDLLYVHCNFYSVICAKKL